MNFTRPEIFEIFVKINGWFYYIPKIFNLWEKRFSIFDIFWFGSDEYKENFIKYVNWEDKRILQKDIQSYDDLELFKTQFYTNFDKDIKRGKVFSNINAFNLFFIMYNNAKSINKYWIRRYLFKEYIESDELLEFKIEKLKKAIIDFYTNEEDINKYIYWNDKFIYSDYSNDELKVLYKMWLFIRDEVKLEWNIFNKCKSFDLVEVIIAWNISTKNSIKKWKIFSNDIIYECFLYLYNNTKSYRKYKTREVLFREFLEKDIIGVKVAIKYIEILIDYIKDQDEIFSSPLYKLLDDFKLFNDECKKEYDEINKNADMIYSDIELKFLSIFYNTDNIKGYKYYESIEYMDSQYLEKNDTNKEWDLWISHVDYNNLFK